MNSIYKTKNNHLFPFFIIITRDAPRTVFSKSRVPGTRPNLRAEYRVPGRVPGIGRKQGTRPSNLILRSIAISL